MIQSYSTWQTMWTMCVHLMSFMVWVSLLQQRITVPKKIVPTDSLIQTGKIEIKFIEPRIEHSFIKYQNLKHLFCEEGNTISFF